MQLNGRKWETTIRPQPVSKKQKNVVSTTLKKPECADTTVLKDNAVSEIKKLKEQDGPEIQVHGSNLIQTLLKHDLVDEFRLKIYPVTLGKGKRLFAEETIPAGFQLVESNTSPKGVILASYIREGGVKTGSFAM